MNNNTERLANSLQQESDTRLQRYNPTSTASEYSAIATVATGTVRILGNINQSVAEMDRRAREHTKGDINNLLDYVQHNPDFVAHNKTKGEAYMATGDALQAISENSPKHNEGVNMDIETARSQLNNFIEEYYGHANVVKNKLNISKGFNDLKDLITQDGENLWDPKVVEKVSTELDEKLNELNQAYANSPEESEYIAIQTEKLIEAFDNAKQQTTAKHIGGVAMDFFTGQNKPYQSYREIIKSKEGEQQMQALKGYLGDKRASDFIKGQWETHITSAASDLTIPLAELKDDIKYAGLSPDLYEHVRQIRMNKIATPPRLTTLDQKKLQIQSPDAAILSTQLTSSSLINGGYDFQYGREKMLSQIKNDDTLTDSEKLYKENLINQLYNLKTAKTNENPLEMAISTGVVTPDGMTKTDPQNKFSDRINAGVLAGKTFGKEPSFFTNEEVEQLRTNDPQFMNPVRDITKLQNVGVDEQIALNKQLRSTGTKLDYYTDAGLTPEDIDQANKTPQKSGVTLPPTEFVSDILHPFKAAVSSIGRSEEKLTGSFSSRIPLFNPAEKEVGNLIASDPQLFDRVYSVYAAKSKLSTSGKIEIPTASQVFKDAGLELTKGYTGLSSYIASGSKYSIYHKRGVDPKPAIRSLTEDIENLRSRQRSTLTTSNFTIKNIDADTIGIFSTTTGKPVYDELTGTQLVASLKNPVSIRKNSATGATRGLREPVMPSRVK